MRRVIPAEGRHTTHWVSDSFAIKLLQRRRQSGSPGVPLEGEVTQWRSILKCTAFFVVLTVLKDQIAPLYVS